MKTRLIGKITLVVIFLAAVFCLVVQPALAGAKSKDNDNNNAAVNAEQKGKKNQEEVDQILANGPPIKPEPETVTYIKYVPGNGKEMIKDFTNGHPNPNSRWEPYHQ